jgi:hypothetical protein
MPGASVHYQWRGAAPSGDEQTAVGQPVREVFAREDLRAHPLIDAVEDRVERGPGSGSDLDATAEINLATAATVRRPEPVGQAPCGA